jgi:hypothetical protein
LLQASYRIHSFQKWGIDSFASQALFCFPSNGDARPGEHMKEEVTVSALKETAVEQTSA